jgi:SOS-response transcriptional repressor LexA
MGWTFDEAGGLPMRKVSETTVQVWKFLAAYIDEQGYPPTLAEIAQGCHVSRTTVERHLMKLDGRGVIELHQGARAIKLVERPPH